jgi:hypothetical protein
VLSGEIAEDGVNAARPRLRQVAAVVRQQARSDASLTTDLTASDRAMNDLERENAMWERMEKDLERKLRSICTGC